LKEALSSLADLNAENDTLKERYQAAVELAATLTEMDKSKDAVPVQEASIDEYPELINLENLRSANEKYLSDCNESVVRINVPAGPSASVINFAGAVAQSTDETNEVITESEITKSSGNDRRVSASTILAEGNHTNSPEMNILDNLLESTGGR
jgi:hypothetical protein